jgi:hypothetical protein
MINFEDIKKVEDERLNNMCKDVDIVLNTYRLTDFLQEQPDGRLVLAQGYSPFLPKEAFITEGNYPSDLDCLVENIKNFKWGIKDNIIPALENYFIDDKKSIKHLNMIVSELDDFLKNVVPEISLSTKEKTEEDFDLDLDI